MATNKPPTAHAPIDAATSFEDALKELEAIVRKLENGSGDLESSISDYVRGTELKQFCDKKLAQARLKVESILEKQGQDQKELTLQPFDTQES